MCLMSPSLASGFFTTSDTWEVYLHIYMCVNMYIYTYMYVYMHMIHIPGNGFKLVSIVMEL